MMSYYRGSAIVGILTASALVGLLAVITALQQQSSTTTVLIQPNVSSVLVGDTLLVDVIVRSDNPVNVFSGKIIFDAALAEIVDISYNTSIADLWTETPWYENGAGTITFAGGTTVPGGFVGSGVLMSIEYRAVGVGQQTLRLTEGRVLAHDGFGTDTTIISTDGIFEISTNSKTTFTPTETNVLFLPPLATFDLNNDGTITMADVSLFFTHLITGNLQSDFNNDGRVTIADLSLILAARRHYSDT